MKTQVTTGGDRPSAWRRVGRTLLAFQALVLLAQPAMADTPPQMFGVNLSGGEATGAGVVPGTYGTHYIYPSDAELAYYQSKGLNLIRLPVKWRRIQQNLGDPLYETDMARIDTVIGYARARGMKVILDLHDYGEYKVGGVTYTLGDSTLTNAVFADLWSKIAARYQGETALYGYDLMNEPKLSVTVWKAAAQAAIDAIRAQDTQAWILVEGIHYSRAWGWVKDGNGALIDLTDPADRLIYSAHSYWDEGGSGTYTDNYAQDNRYPEVGINHVKPFVEWCQQNGVNGLIGEYGIPWNDGYAAEWNTVLRNFLDYITANGMSGTYWAGGLWNGSYHLSCEPTSNFTIDKPVMTVLQSTPPDPVITIDNNDPLAVTLTGAWTAAASTPGFYGSNYLHDGNTGKGSKSVRFTPDIPAAGDYEVFVRWVSGTNRSASVPVSIIAAGGTTVVPVNQQIDNGVWKSLGTYAFQAGTGGGVLISNSGTTGHVIADAVCFSPNSSLPAGWTSGDVGSVGAAGGSAHSGGVFTVNGSGATIGGTADSFHLAYRTVTGDCTITARVATQTNTSTYARAGVMIRDGLAANAMLADAIVTPLSGLYMQSRLTAGATLASGSGGAGAAPYWLRVKRVGNVFTGYKSTDGTTWTQMSTPKTIAMASTVNVGLAVCSCSNSSLGTATFDNVTVTAP